MHCVSITISEFRNDITIKNGDFYLGGFNIFVMVVSNETKLRIIWTSKNGNRMKEYKASDQGDWCVLEENDIPGASLKGRKLKPIELNITQLKRWLSCQGVPVTGKKAEHHH